MIVKLAILLLSLGVPPLTDLQKDILAIEEDPALLAGPTLTPLLENVSTWEDALDETVTRAPDYPALYEDSQRYRGEAFVIEGRFAGRARRIDLQHVGEWGDALTEWVLIVNDDPEEVAVVFLVDILADKPTPRVGAHVKTVGRFYKVWHDRDQNGRPADYLTFVAGPVDVDGGWQRQGPSPAIPILLLTLGLAAVYILIRIHTRRYTHKSPQQVMLSDQPADPLPGDPAEALQRLADRHHDS